MPWLIWGIFVRLVAVWHTTWLVNSACHLWGKRNYNTKDTSTNNWLVAFLTFGEGWHQNHHSFPFSSRHGLKWFEFDINYTLILLLNKLKLAKEIKVPSNKQLLENLIIK